MMTVAGVKASIILADGKVKSSANDDGAVQWELVLMQPTELGIAEDIYGGFVRARICSRRHQLQLSSWYKN